MIKLMQGDCLEKMKEIEDGSIDSIVTDPPYELNFMGNKWDNTGIANNHLMWSECLRILKPGGHLLSFGGARTYHRMASAIEDAGFEVRDMIEWVYGSGFPKSLNIGKAVDKFQGNEREVVRDMTGAMNNAENSEAQSFTKGDVGFKTHFTETKGTSEWEGWGTALKPAHEPICMARKPLSEKTVAENCLKWGTGGINIDESRVGQREKEQFTGKKEGSINAYGNYFYEKSETPLPSGRFPANLIHDNSEEVRECFPNESWRFFKSIIYQAKVSNSERNKGCEGLQEKQAVGGGGGIGDYLKDVNSASGKYGSEKAPSKNNHPTVKPIALMEYLIKMVTPKGGIVLDPFMGSGTTGLACKNLNLSFIGIELDETYFKIAEERINNA